ncbi:MAG: GNAT family N-acetyltransferase [Ignavibacteria bacterium]|nr:GNAT family N-acetyltransferase [Ignavibacteria bacterium]
MSLRIEPLTEQYFELFINLIYDLASYEKLDPPTPEAVERLHRDAFSETKRYNAILALDENNLAVGYAIYFETYSSFLAKPTIYLEDLYVAESHRLKGAGSALFDFVYNLGNQRGCGRMEWQVLDWNHLARDFYQARNAEHLKDWLTYRITYSTEG